VPRPSRPSPAMIVALIALVAALAGGAYAATKVKRNSVVSRSVVNGSLLNKDLRRNTLNGSRIKEGSLGRVPRSGDAETVNGARVVPIHHVSGDAESITLVSLNTFVLRASCTAGVESLFADTTANDGEISSISTDADNGSTFNTQDDDFSPDDNLPLTIGTSSDRVYDIHYSGDAGQSVSVGVVTEDDLSGGNCVITGHAVGSK
jgi:hypothetical protein